MSFPVSDTMRVSTQDIESIDAIAHGGKQNSGCYKLKDRGKFLSGISFSISMGQGHPTPHLHLIGIESPLGSTTMPELGLGHLAGFPLAGLLLVEVGTVKNGRKQIHF